MYIVHGVHMLPTVDRLLICYSIRMWAMHSNGPIVEKTIFFDYKQTPGWRQGSFRMRKCLWCVWNGLVQPKKSVPNCPYFPYFFHKIAENSHIPPILWPKKFPYFPYFFKKLIGRPVNGDTGVLFYFALGQLTVVSWPPVTSLSTRVHLAHSRAVIWT